MWNMFNLYSARMSIVLLDLFHGEEVTCHIEHRAAIGESRAVHDRESWIGQS